MQQLILRKIICDIFLFELKIIETHLQKKKYEQKQ